MSSRIAKLAMAGCIAVVAACNGTPEKQLEEVAKDWNKVIRASQVIPVYPLTQDLQPGDLFLVQVPIEEQQEIWKKAGYLPLDYHLARIEPSGYSAFYGNSFLGPEGSSVLPKDWLNVGQPPGGGAGAPGAAFPTYSFSVKSSSGLNLALPVSGVPIGLSLLGADAAEGTVSLADARTLGIDVISLAREVERWALDNHDFLRGFGPLPGKQAANYLRVVDRVYFVGSLDVSLRSTETRSAGLDVAAPKPVELLTLDPGTDAAQATADSYAKGLAAMNEMITASQAAGGDGGSALPGGSVRVTGASSRSISMTETFDPPLVVGYLGFDLPILEGGVLGSPIPTHSLVTKRISAPSTRIVAGDPIGEIASQVLATEVWKVLASRKNDPRAKAILEKLQQLVNDLDWDGNFYRIDRNGMLVQATRNATVNPQDPATTADLHSYSAALLASVNGLRESLAKSSFSLVTGNVETTVDAQAPQRGELEQELSALEALSADLIERDMKLRAVAIAHLNYLVNY